MTGLPLLLSPRAGAMVEVVGTRVRAGGVASIPLAADGVHAAPRADAP
jgi:hypothetical protein